MSKSFKSQNIYIPKKGDIIWINFNPQVGREQRGRRPGLVISPNIYNRKVGLVLVCPITSIFIQGNNLVSRYLVEKKDIE